MNYAKSIVILVVWLFLSVSMYPMGKPSLAQFFEEDLLALKSPEAQLREFICLSIKFNTEFHINLIHNLSEYSVNEVFKLAAEFNRPDIIQFILNNKTLCEKITHHGVYATSNALWQAAQRGFVMIVSKLLDHEGIRKQLFDNDQQFGNYVALHTLFLVVTKSEQIKLANPLTIQKDKIQTLEVLLKNSAISLRLNAELIQKAAIEACKSGYKDIAQFLENLNCPLL